MLENVFKDILSYLDSFNLFNLVHCKSLTSNCPRVQVKHVTTHRSEPRGMSDAPSLVYSHPHGPVTGAGAKLSMPGVIVQ